MGGETAGSEDYEWAADLPGLDRVRPTDVPGLVICQYRRSGKRPQCYTVTHAASGKALTRTLRCAAGPRRLRVAEKIVRYLGELRYRRRPVDWTLPTDDLNKMTVVRRALDLANGWIVLSDKRSLNDQWRDIDEFRERVGLPVIPRPAHTPTEVAS